MKIKLLQDMTSCITDGQRLIKKGTQMVECHSQLSWLYFKDDEGKVLIIQDWSSKDWNKVEIVN